MHLFPASGEVSWTPTSDNIIFSDTNWTLTIIATDPMGAETILPLNVKLCACEHNGTCLYNQTLFGSENYQVKNGVCFLP